MTTPTNPPEEGAESAPPHVPAAATAPPPDGYQYPFAPVYRAPRTPWVNPARRGHVAAAAIAGALIFGGGGLLVGHAVTGHDDHHARYGVVGIEPGDGMGGPGFGRGQYPRRPNGPRQQRPNVPAPSTPVPPTGSSTR